MTLTYAVTSRFQRHLIVSYLFDYIIIFGEKLTVMPDVEKLTNYYIPRTVGADSGLSGFWHHVCFDIFKEPKVTLLYYISV